VCLLPATHRSAPMAQPRLATRRSRALCELATSGRRYGGGTASPGGGPSGRRVAELVLNAEPTFRFVQPLVEALCQDPWSIRRPRDLARQCRVTLAWCGVSARSWALIGSSTSSSASDYWRTPSSSRANIYRFARRARSPVSAIHPTCGAMPPAARHSPIVGQVLSQSDRRHHHLRQERVELA